MMTSGYFFLVMVLLTFLFTGHVEAGLVLEAHHVEAGLVLEAHGEIQLRRRHWQEFYRVREEVQLYRGDLLRLVGDAKAVIMCADFATIWSPTSGGPIGATQDCPLVQNTPLIRDGQRASGSRSDTELHLPYIIVPRNTVISDPHPMLRWNALPGAQQYSVQVVDIRRPSRPIWGPVTVGEPKMRYPEHAPALQPEIKYIMQVTTDGDAYPPTDEVWFRLASAKKRGEIARRRDGLRRQIPHESAQQLALAVYYLHQELRSEALAFLDTLVRESTSAPVHLLRAHILLEAQLIQAASQQYVEAQRLAVQQHDQESQADALVGLARTTHDRVLTGQHYLAAIELYQRLGDRERAEKIAEEMPSVP
jgi:hypothetical protein